jgi:hypothetical protein
MEPSGRNRWQPVANGKAQRRLKRAKTLAMGCHQLPETIGGKDDGAHFRSGAFQNSANSSIVQQAVKSSPNRASRSRVATSSPPR